MDQLWSYIKRLFKGLKMEADITYNELPLYEFEYNFRRKTPYRRDLYK